METQAVPFYKRKLVRWAVAAAVIFCGAEFYLVYEKETVHWNWPHPWAEFALAIIPNLIAGALTFLAVDFVVERKDARDRYVAAMKSIRLAAKGMPNPLTEKQVQDLMVTSVKEISTLYFGQDKPPCSGKQPDSKSCTNCPTHPQPPASDGSCSHCNELPECWSVEPKRPATTGK